MIRAEPDGEIRPFINMCASRLPFWVGLEVVRKLAVYGTLQTDDLSSNPSICIISITESGNSDL
jgi:hypothetical protein